MATRQQTNKLSGDAHATLIGEDIQVVGRIEGREELKVQGYVEGSILLTETLIVDKGGVVVAEVRALDVIVYGIVVGDVVADRRIVLHAGARVVGDLKAPRVTIAGGAAFRGQVSMGSTADEGQHHEESGHRSGSGRWRGGSSSSRGGGARQIGARSRVSRSVPAKPTGALARASRAHEIEEPGPRQPPLRKRIGREVGREIGREVGREIGRDLEREVAPEQVPLDSFESDENDEIDGDPIDVDDGMITDGGKKKRAARPRVPVRGKHSVDHA